jgi:hypothetical protein
MADRYWVGGTGNWGDAARWSASSGGAGGASVPGANDDVYFDENSNVGTGAFTVTVNTVTRSARNFTASGLDGVMTLAGDQTLIIRGDFFLPATNFISTLTGNISLSMSTSSTANFNGNTMAGNVTLGSSTGTDLTLTMLSGVTTTGDITFSGNATSLVNMGGFTYTCSRCSSTLTQANITMGAGAQIVVTGTGTVLSFANDLLFINDIENADFVLTNTTTSARTLALGNNAFGRIEIGGATGTSTVTITGSASIRELACSKTVASTIRFTDGTTQSIERWTASGTAGNLLTLSGTSTGGWTVNCTSPYFVSAEYLSISYSTATPPDTWYAGETSTNGGNNTGWSFAPAEDNFLTFFPAAGA